MNDRSASSQNSAIKLDQLVYVELEGNGGMMLSVSESGFSFRAVSPIRPTLRVPFSFTINNNQRLTGYGRIEWTKDDGKVASLQFSDVTSPFLDALRKWIAQLTAAGALSYSESRTEPPSKSSATLTSTLHHAADSPRVAAFSAALEQQQDPVQSIADSIGQPAVYSPTGTPPIEPPAFSQPLADPSLSFGRTPEPEQPRYGYNIGPAQPAASSAASNAPREQNSYSEPMRQTPVLSSWNYPEDLLQSDQPRFSKTAIVALAICFAVLVVALYAERELLGQTLISLGQKLSRPAESTQAAPPPAPSQEPVKSAITTPPVEAKPVIETPEPTSKPNHSGSVSPKTAIPTTPASTVDDASFRNAVRQPRPAASYSPSTADDAGHHDPADEVRSLWSAVGAGNTAAEVTLARLYLIGGGVEKNCDQAKVLLNAAAKKGNGEARDKLAQLYREGCPR
jgi:hypothetical protein